MYIRKSNTYIENKIYPYATIDDLRSQVNDLKNTITANGIGSSIISQVRPYPVPSYLVSSPYQSLYNGFYGSNWYGNAIV